MSLSVARKRKLLEPPEVKPVLTTLLLFLSICFVGDPSKGYAFTQWCAEHSVTAQKFFSLLEKNDMVALLNMCFQASIAQMGPFSFLFDAMFWWIFGTVVEKKLVSWRYPVFLCLGLVGCWALLVYEAAPNFAASQRFLSPIMFMMYLLGAYLVFKPKKPFKPAEWKPPPWKVFKTDENAGEKKLKVPFVSPWIYVGLFLAWAAFLQYLTSASVKDIIDVTHLPISGKVRTLIAGTISPGSFQVLRPIPAVYSILLGVLSAYILQSIVFKAKFRRDAGDLQLQAVLQYKELRALDMNHKQAVEGTARLIGVPLDIAKDWISKGLQAPPKD